MFCTFTLALSTVCVQCPIRLFYYYYYYYYYTIIFTVITRLTNASLFSNKRNAFKPNRNHI